MENTLPLWKDVPAFGVQPEGMKCVVRPSAYALMPDKLMRLAVMRTAKGEFLPGGGLEAGESIEAAAIREVREECGLTLRPGKWLVRAVQFVYSPIETTHFEKRSSFIEGSIDDATEDVVASEADHELLWISSHIAMLTLSHESHGWAVRQWRSHVGLSDDAS